MNRAVTILCCGLAVLPGVLCASGADALPDVQTIELDDLWENTPVTKDLSYTWRIYRRFRLLNRLHEQLRLHLINPKDWRPEDRRPAIVFIHGGGWGAGDPDQWYSQCRYFALRGLVTASVQYRLKSENVSVADCYVDCKSAIRYLRRHGSELGIDPVIEATPNLLVLLNPITDLTTRWGEGLGERVAALSPLQHISQRTPPTLLIDGDADRVVDFVHSQTFHKRMIERGRPSWLIVLPGADHAFAVFEYGADSFVSQTIVEIDRFLMAQGYLHDEPLLTGAMER